MITLIDGKVEGTYLVKRAPIFLRAVIDERTGDKDVLNELDDEPRPTEKVYIYKLFDDTSPVHLNFGGGKGGFYVMGKYRHLPDVDGETLRETEVWRAWCIAHTEEVVDKDTGVIKSE